MTIMTNVKQKTMITILLMVMLLLSLGSVVFAQSLSANLKYSTNDISPANSSVITKSSSNSSEEISKQIVLLITIAGFAGISSILLIPSREPESNSAPKKHTPQI
jgi:hypothetical protein